MTSASTRMGGRILGVTLCLGLLAALPATASITTAVGFNQGTQTSSMTPTFTLGTGTAMLAMPDGPTVHVWGFSAGGGPVQYPGPTLIVRQGATVTINLTNNLAEPVSLVFPGMTMTSSVAPVFVGGTRAGLRSLAPEAAANGGSATYTFTASKAGTFVYHSGTNMAKQVYMGLHGVIVVRPTGYTENPTADTEIDHALLTRFAYSGDPATEAATSYQREYLFVETEIDPRINSAVSRGLTPDFTDWRPVYWLFNGRCFPDTVMPDNLPWLPNQPYGALAAVHPGETALVRLVSMGRDPHPFHTHGNHMRLVAQNGNVFQTAPDQGLDLSTEVYTHSPVPGQTFDGLWTWTGENLGWDIYGDVVHDCIDVDLDGFADANSDFPYEYCADHDKPFPTALPDENALTFGGFYSGSPYMGSLGGLPPGEGGLNPTGGFFFVWHSHAEKELTNNDIFPGGQLSQMAVIPFGAPLSY